MVAAVGIIVDIVIGAEISKRPRSSLQPLAVKRYFSCSGLGPIRKMNLMNLSSTT
jgi:hypothetical protein